MNLTMLFVIILFIASTVSEILKDYYAINYKVEGVVRQHNKAMKVLDSNHAFLDKKFKEYDAEINTLNAEIKSLKERESND